MPMLPVLSPTPILCKANASIREAYAAMPAAERLSIQSDLIWSGDHNGGVTGAFGGPADKPFWHLERARIENTRDVPVEVIVNGVSVARQRITADGTARDLTFEVPIERSSWVALRILPSSHTNPIFIEVAQQPIRVRRSIEWCLAGVDACWAQKEKLYAEPERPEARAAFEHARTVYRARLAESRD